MALKYTSNFSLSLRWVTFNDREWFRIYEKLSTNAWQSTIPKDISGYFSQFFFNMSSLQPLGCNIPLIQNLPKRRFSATSLKEDAFNLRFTPGTPWCPAERPPLEADYAKEYVLVDLGCPRSICTVESKDENLMTYSGEYSIDKKNWKKLSTNDTTHYYMEVKVFWSSYEREIA